MPICYRSPGYCPAPLAHLGLMGQWDLLHPSGRSDRSDPSHQTDLLRLPVQLDHWDQPGQTDLLRLWLHLDPLDRLDLMDRWDPSHRTGRLPQ